MYTTYVIDRVQTFSAPIKFKLTKTIECRSLEQRNILVEKLERLKTENFNRIRLPKFDFTVSENTVVQNMQFIKGQPFGTLISPHQEIVYEDIVLKDSDWTFLDYNTLNFPVERKIDKIYAIDFQSYSYCPDIDERKKLWALRSELHKEILSQISS